MWIAEVSRRPDDIDIDLEVTVERGDSWRWTVWFVRLIRSGVSPSVKEAQDCAAQELEEMANKYRSDLPREVYENIQYRRYQWKEEEG